MYSYAKFSTVKIKSTEADKTLSSFSQYRSKRSIPFYVFSVCILTRITASLLTPRFKLRDLVQKTIKAPSLLVLPFLLVDILNICADDSENVEDKYNHKSKREFS